MARRGVLDRLRRRRTAAPRQSSEVLSEAEIGERLRERISQQVLNQWAEGRAARRGGPDPESIAAGESDYRRARVPYGVDLAAAWGWRMLVIAAALGGLLWLLGYFSVVVFPLLIALLLAALASPLVQVLARYLPRTLAALVVEIIGIAAIGLLLTFVGQQVATGVTGLSSQVVSGLEEIRRWLQHGPLHASDSQIDAYITNLQDYVKEQGVDLAGRLTEVGTALGHIVAGLFIILFGTYFFLADGKMIWLWVVRIFPRQARTRVDSSGHVAWRSLTQFVRATVLVAGTDAIAVMIWAAALGLPLVGAIGVLVFLGAFVPLIGATLSGAVAVLVALVAKGPVAAFLMLVGVVVVQQIEAHLLQPFLMGRFVSVHPLGVIVAIAAGVLVAGVGGALIAVPLAAAGNAVVQHLASFTEIGDDAHEAADRDPMPSPETEAGIAQTAAQHSGSEGEESEEVPGDRAGS